MTFDTLNHPESNPEGSQSLDIETKSMILEAFWGDLENSDDQGIGKVLLDKLVEFVQEKTHTDVSATQKQALSDFLVEKKPFLLFTADGFLTEAWETIDQTTLDTVLLSARVLPQRLFTQRDEVNAAFVQVMKKNKEQLTNLILHSVPNLAISETSLTTEEKKKKVLPVFEQLVRIDVLQPQTKNKAENQVTLDRYQMDLLWKGVGTVHGLREQLFELFSGWIKGNSQEEFEPRYQDMIQKYVDGCEEEVYEHATTFSEEKVRSLQQSIINSDSSTRNLLVVEIQTDYLTYITDDRNQQKVIAELSKARSLLEKSKLQDKFISKPTQN